MKLDVKTTHIPGKPRPAKTTSMVIQISPAGVAVVGELNSSKAILLATHSFARNIIARRPAIAEHAQ
jgi:hypothetical protein